MATSRFDSSWETNIYSKGLQINRYPYGELVSVFFRGLKHLRTRVASRNQTRILEIGCGAGNNLQFFCQEGFAVYGIDGSRSACEIANKQLSSLGYSTVVKQAEFDDLPFGDQHFDIIVDREATYCGRIEDIRQTWREADRVLKLGGLVISFFFADDHPDCVEAGQNPEFARELEPNTFTDFQSGGFAGSGIAHFASYEELLDIFGFLDIKLINKHSSRTVIDSQDGGRGYSEWILVGVKK